MKLEDEFARVLSFSVGFCWKKPFFPLRLLVFLYLDPILSLLLPRRRKCPEKVRYEESSHGCSWELNSLYFTFWEYINGSGSLLLVFSKWSQICLLSLRRRRRFDCGWDWWSVEGTPRRCYQTPGTIKWGLQHKVPETVHIGDCSRQLIEQSLDDDFSCFQVRKLVVLSPLATIIGSFN